MELKSKEMKIAEELILKAFNFLVDDYMFSPQLKTEESLIFIESIAIEFIHNNYCRNVRVSYVKGKVYNDIKYTFEVSITRIPYTGKNDFLSVSNYLNSKNEDFNTSLTNDFNSEKAENILNKMASILRSELFNVVDGSAWYENYYPRID